MVNENVPVVGGLGQKRMLSIAGRILGIFGYGGVGGVMGLGADLLQVADDYRDRKRREERERFERLMLDFEVRISHLESDVDAKDASDNQVDLFVEVLRKAIQDDEREKESLYAGILEWIVREKPRAEHVRIVSGAIESLSFVEVRFFLLNVAGRRKHAMPLIENLIPEVVVWHRLTGAGLTDDSIRVNGSPTIFGSVIAKYCPVDSSVPSLE